jgi:hypothetical protein
MAFLTSTCPDCGQSIAPAADFCVHCGCPAARKFSACTSCGSSVGSDSRFCWKCGCAQPASAQRHAFYGDRWRRSATDFATRVELAVPEKTLHHGLQVDEGTLAVLFQNGRLVGTLEPGYHTFDTFVQRLLGFDKGGHAHAILLDTRAAEVDFRLPEIRTAQQIPVEVRLRLLFQVTDPHRFVDAFFKGTSGHFTTADLTRQFDDDVREALQIVLATRPLDSIACEARTRELVEGQLILALAPVLERCGLRITAVRLADFTGPAIESLRAKFSEISRLNRENELNRALQDALRIEKLAAFHDEEQLRHHYEKITHEYGLSAAGREDDKRLFIQAAEHRFQTEGLKQDYERRRAEILNRLDEQNLSHQAALLDVRHEQELARLRFQEEIARRQTTFEIVEEERKRGAVNDAFVAEQGITVYSKMKDAKLAARAREEALATAQEAERLRVRGAASPQALLASLDGPQADRLLKLAELEMRRGLSAEQALALVAEKSPEIAPAVAAAIAARRGGEPA